MGYNLSKGPLVRMERYLQDMSQSRSSLRWITVRPQSLAYKIREAMHGAKHHKEYEHYDKLRHIFKIRESPKCVEAIYIGTEYIEPTAPTKLEVDMEITLAIGIVGSVIKLGAQTNEIHFTDANLTEEESESLYKWTSVNGWTYINHYDGTVTVTQKVVDPDIIWSPS